MPTAVAPLARQLEERARRDSGFAEVLEALLEAPTMPQGNLEHLAARELNAQRRRSLRDEFLADAIPTPKVQELLALGTPQAVHQLRSRGKVIGAAIGNRTWFPGWQFAGDRLRPDLPRILELLARFTSDPFAADRIMRITRDEFGGASIAQALRRKKTADAAWRMLTAVGA
jgi:hypothetical protein